MAQEQVRTLHLAKRAKHLRFDIDRPCQSGRKVFGGARRLFDSNNDDAIDVAVDRPRQCLADGVSNDTSAIDLILIRDQLRSEVVVRLTEIGVAVNPNGPVVILIIARCTEILKSLAPKVCDPRELSGFAEDIQCLGGATNFSGNRSDRRKLRLTGALMRQHHTTGTRPDRPF